jgi:hypothetical protein
MPHFHAKHINIKMRDPNSLRREAIPVTEGAHFHSPAVTAARQESEFLISRICALVLSSTA